MITLAFIMTLINVKLNGLEILNLKDKELEVVDTVILADLSDIVALDIVNTETEEFTELDESDELKDMEELESTEELKDVEEYREEDDSIVKEVMYNREGYKVTREELFQIIAGCIAEQGSEKGALNEASLLCNLFEQDNRGFENPAEYIKKSSWFASRTRRIARKGTYIGESLHGVSITMDLYKKFYDIVINGNRLTIADEHDCFKDIEYIENNGDIIKDRDEINNRSNYIPGKTRIVNRFGSTYTFIHFGDIHADPFGITR